jgi:predicted DNA-binding ribbon-helix-helix protein
MPPHYARAVKRSVTIAGHETSLALEPMFWAVLDDAAERRALPLNALIAQIDAERLTVATPPNLSSAVRTWALAEALGATALKTMTLPMPLT